MPAVVATTIMSFCGVLIETSMNVTFPTLMKQFGIDAGLIQWVTTANLLTVAISIPLSAYLIRNISEKNLFISSNLFFSAWRDFGFDCGKFRTVVSRSHPSGNRHRTCPAACDAHYFGARSVGKTRFHGRRGHDDDLLCACNRSDLWRNYSASF